MSNGQKLIVILKKLFNLSITVGTLIAVLLLMGCGKPAPAQSIQYKKPIDLHLNKNAVLFLEPGKQKAVKIASNQNNDINNKGNNDLVGMMISTAKTSINQINLLNRPNGYFVSYGREDQLNFMNCLKEVLSQNEVFRNVEVAASAKACSPQDVSINVFFKKTRICCAERNYGSTLRVVMTITAAGKPPFTRSYFVKNDPAVTGLVRLKRDVSNRLMAQLMMGLQEWSEGKK